MKDPLVRYALPQGFIDLAVGEAHVVRHALRAAYPQELFEMGALEDCTYQPPSGWAPLVRLLEERTNKRVVITCGAKQALCAVAYALKKRGFAGVSMRAPYWSQLYAVVTAHRLRPVFIDRPLRGYAHLVVSPNNPDGHVTSLDEFKQLRARCDELKAPLIHDAAYHHGVYMPAFSEQASAVPAHASIYSASKATGLSGLRVGYVAIDSSLGWMHDSVQEYVEMTSAGVSLPAQWFLHELLVAAEASPGIRSSDHAVFVALARASLHRAKDIAARLDPAVLDTSAAEKAVGMFGWYKVGPRFDPDRARVSVAPGAAFGAPGYARLNLAVEPAVLQEAVKRLNSASA